MLKQLKDEMQQASKDMAYEKAARLRDEITMLERLDERGELDTHVQPEVFYIDPKKGLGWAAESSQIARTASCH